MTGVPDRARPLIGAHALLFLLLGGTALWLGVALDAVALWGFGAACLLEVPPSLSLWGRLQDGLGNRGLERERVTLRTVSVLLRLLALGMGVVVATSLSEAQGTQTQPMVPVLAGLALGLLAALWLAKRGHQGTHPALDLDAVRSRALLELAALLLVGCLLGRWFPWAGGITALAMAVRLFLSGQLLARATTLSAVACGGCGGGGCG